MTATVAEIINLMERLAPTALAEDWDNVGLQVGKRDWPVRKISVALDPLPEVVALCAPGTDLLISHHPLTLDSFKTLDLASPFGSIVEKAVQNRMAIFAAHTNLDSVREGLNDLLASKIALTHCERLAPIAQDVQYKIVIYAPVEHEQAVLKALFEAGAGEIGAYTHCSFRTQGTGTFKPDPSAQPYSGTPGAFSQVDELRIEAVVPKKKLAHVVTHVRKHHPYETMAYDAYPLYSVESTDGLGCVGEFEKPVLLEALAKKIKQALGLDSLRIVGPPDLTVKQAAVCSGSGSSLLPLFLNTDAQVFISGDWRYHDARQAEAHGRGLIDIGHFASEHIIVKDLAIRLQKEIENAGLPVRVEACEIEEDPFKIII